jgi:hypothetical protein
MLPEARRGLQETERKWLPCQGGSTTKFAGYKKQRLPVVIYADFESTLADSNVVSKNGKEREVGYVNARHEANSYRIQIVSDVPLGIPMESSHVGLDAARHFIQTILKLDKEISDCLHPYINQFEVLPPLSREYSNAYYSQPTCLYCNKEFVEGISKLQRVRDHCHFTGKYIGLPFAARPRRIATVLARANERPAKDRLARLSTHQLFRSGELVTLTGVRVK